MKRHFIAKSDEAFWSGPERCWASVQQFAPRTTLAGHLRAATWGGIIALAVILLEAAR